MHTEDRAGLAGSCDDMYLGWLCVLIFQALSQAGFGKNVLAQQLAKVHLDRVFQNDIVLICNQNVVNETKGASLHSP